MTDALSRLAPVAGPLLDEVDAALSTLGAPPAHPVWRLLGSVGTTPAALVAFVADLEPERLRGAASVLRGEERAYGRLSIPREEAWAGAAARDYATVAVALREHLNASGDESLTGRLRGTASYVERVADWQQGLRDELARVLAGVLTSREAALMRTQRGQADTAALSAAVMAAAEIGAALLRVAEAAARAGRAAIAAPSGLDELVYRPPAHTSTSYDGPIHVPLP